MHHSLGQGLRLTLDSGLDRSGPPEGERKTDQVARYIDLIGNEQFSIRVAAIRELIGLGQQAVPALIRALQEGLWFTRECAAQALGHIGDPQAIGPLIACLEDENIGVRRSAARALSDIIEGAGLTQVASVVAQLTPTAARDTVELIRKASPLAGRKLDEVLGEPSHHRGEQLIAEESGHSADDNNHPPLSAAFRSLWERLRDHLQSRS
jgi:HEAT repeat protein